MAVAVAGGLIRVVATAHVDRAVDVACGLHVVTVLVPTRGGNNR